MATEVKYHISPSTGNPNRCYASKKPCPLGGSEAHYGTKEEARAAYEAGQVGGALPVSRKAPQASVQEEGVSYTFPARRLPEALNSIEKANRRLERFGIAERFTVEVEEWHRTVPADTPFAPPLREKMVRLTVANPSISYGGYRFLAAVTEEDAGLITRTGHGVELGGWRPTSLACEHCGHNRARSKTYLVEGPDGVRKQIGSSCVEGYIGVRPEGLWALNATPIDPQDYEDEADGPRDRTVLEQPVDYALGIALAVSDGGENFVSKAKAWEYGIESTAERVATVTWGGNISPEEREAILGRAAGYVASGKVKEVLSTIEKLEGTSDYAVNLKTAAAGEWVKYENVAVLVSGLSSYTREKRRAEAAAAPQPTKGFLAPPQTKLKGVKAKVKKVRHLESTDPWGRPQVRSQVVYEDEQGHELIWWASKAVGVKEGATVTFSGGTVKAHGNFNGVDQTVLTRVKMEEDA